MEYKYIDLLYTLSKYNCQYSFEWIDADRFKLTINNDSIIIDQSTTSVGFPVMIGPRRVKPTGFDKVHKFYFQNDEENEDLEFYFSNETYLENQKQWYQCNDGIKLFIEQKPILNEYMIDNCIRTQSTKWDNFQKKYDIEVTKTVLEHIELTENYNLEKFMLWVDGNVYSQYFKFHKPSEFIMLNNSASKIEEDNVIISLRTMNNISKKCAGIPFINNLILKAIGFKKEGQNCKCNINDWKIFKEFMGSSEEVDEEIDIDGYPHGGLYMLQLNCDKGTTKYKIGKAQNLLRRLKSTEYRNAFIMCVSTSKDINKCERELIQEFNKKFINIKTDSTGGFGSEMFSGNVYDMMDLFWQICSKWR